MHEGRLCHHLDLVCHPIVIGVTHDKYLAQIRSRREDAAIGQQQHHPCIALVAGKDVDFESGLHPQVTGEIVREISACWKKSMRDGQICSRISSCRKNPKRCGTREKYPLEHEKTYTPTGTFPVTSINYFGDSIRKRFFSVRIKMAPSSMAQEARARSLRSFFASTSNFFPGLTTVATPSSFW